MRPWDALAQWLARARASERVTVAGIEYDPSTIEARYDVPEALGLTEREFVEALVVENCGRIRRRALSEYTDWSASQSSEVLGELEAEGAIVRTRVGREEIVHLPGEGDAVGLVAPRSE